jgi:hypothetical protein
MTRLPILSRKLVLESAARGADGRLGVQVQGGAAPVNVTMHVTTPDVRGFARSQGQIAAELGRLVGRGMRKR